MSNEFEDDAPEALELTPQANQLDVVLKAVLDKAEKSNPQCKFAGPGPNERTAMLGFVCYVPYTLADSLMAVLDEAIESMTPAIQLTELDDDEQ